MRWSASNKLAQKHFILGGGPFGLLPDSILQGVGDSLHSGADRYTYTVSVPNMYHIVGKERLEMCASQNLLERERKETRSHLKKIFLFPVFCRFFFFFGTGLSTLSNLSLD